MTDKLVKSDAEWREVLSPEEYRIARQKGTERPFSHPGFPKGPGVFCCVACGAPLFESEDKFESGCGWPAFSKPAEDAALEEHEDLSFMMRRTEVTCSRCDAHLGHVFPDGPAERGGLRYCINGTVLRFEPAEGAVTEEET